MAQEWYFGRSGRSQGPVSWDELKARAGEGAVLPTDLVWRAGWDDWRPAEDVAGLLVTPQRAEAAPQPAVRPAMPPPLPTRQLEDEEEPRSEPAGLPLSLLLGMAGAGVAAGMLVVGIVLFVVLRPGQSATGSYQVLLAPGQFDKKLVIFRGRRQAEIRVFTQGQGGEANVDLEIRTEDGLLEAADPGPAADCLVRMIPARTAQYEIRVLNHGPAPARCTVRHE